MDEVRPDIVHSHVPLTHLICHRVLPARRVPWIATIHGSWRQFAYAPQTYGRPYLRPYLLLRYALGDALVTRSAARVVAVADYVKRDLARVGVRGPHVVTILNGIEPLVSPRPRNEARAALGISSDALVVGAMGYHAPVKGFDILVRAFARLVPRFPSAILMIAGGDVLGNAKPRRGLERLITRLDVGDRVRLLAAQDPRSGFMSALDVFVVSSRTEGLSLVLLEAMWHGLPSVVTSEGGCAEAARPGREGLVARMNDPADFAVCIERLLADTDLRESLGRAAWARASAHFGISRCAAEYQKLYQSALIQNQHTQ